MSNLFTSRDPAMTAFTQLAGGAWAMSSFLTDAMSDLMTMPQHDNRYSVAEVTQLVNAANAIIARQNAALQAAASAEADRASLFEAAADQAEESRERILDLETALSAWQEKATALEAQLEGRPTSERRERSRPALSISGAGVRPGF